MPADNPVETPAGTQETANEGAQAPPNAPPPETHIPTGIEDHGHSNNRTENIREWWKVIVETLTLFAVIWYACLASGQLDQMREATVAATSAATTARRALEFTETTEQPLIVLQSIQALNFPNGENPSFVLHFHNYGRNPALNVIGSDAMTFVGADIKSPRFNRPDKGTFGFEVIPEGTDGIRWMAIASPAQFAMHRDEVKKGTVRFYIRVVIGWEDATGKKFPEKTSCAVYNPDSRRPANIGIFDSCQP